MKKKVINENNQEVSVQFYKSYPVLTQKINKSLQVTGF